MGKDPLKDIHEDRTAVIRKPEALENRESTASFRRNAFEIDGRRVKPGTHEFLEVSAVKHFSFETMALPVHVFHGKNDGPRLFVCGAIHGDELCGAEVVRRLVSLKSIRRLRGTLVAVPVVNLHGFINHSRYLPDRRDLNRMFPGSATGSLASRLAHAFLENVVYHCTHGIDLHTAAVHRYNLPQIRAQIDDEATRQMAEAFGVPVIINAKLREGSLRAAASARGIPTLTYEGGEALRFDEVSIKAALQGIQSVMRSLGMLPARAKKREGKKSFVAESATWVRATDSGVFRAKAKAGSRVSKGQVIGHIASPFGMSDTPVEATANGIVIGLTQLPTVNEGDGLFHIATFERARELASYIEQFGEELDAWPTS